jgi:hypothetical protein
MQVDDYKIYMDLLKSKEFEKAAIFKNCKIPSTMFKYYGLNDNVTLNQSKLKYLEEQKIMLCKLNSFNDPFEGNFLIFDKNKLEEKGWNREGIEEYYKTLVGFWNVTCLSNTDEQNMPMWAYYANSHQGFCVEYEFTEDQKHYIFPVNYEENRIYANSIVTHIINNICKAKEGGFQLTGEDHLYNQIVFLSMTAKHTSWQHENEYRIIAPYNDFPATAKNIYIGLNCKDEYKRRLISIGKKFNGYCAVYEMLLDRDNENFELQKKKMV